MSGVSFIEAFCVRHRLPPERFEQAVLRRTLYAHARLLAPLCRFFDRNYLAADVDLVRAAGTLYGARDLTGEIADFTHHPANCGFMREVLRVRISTKRLRTLMRATLH